MSDYAQLQEELALALEASPEAARNRQKRNPPPAVEPAMEGAKTQADWHQVQQALVLEKTTPEQLAMAQGVAEGVPVSAQQGEAAAEARTKEAAERIDAAKRDLADYRAAGQAAASQAAAAQTAAQAAATEPKPPGQPVAAHQPAASPHAEPKKEDKK